GLGPPGVGLAQQAQPVHARHVDVRQDDDQLGLSPVRQLVERLFAGRGKVQHIGAAARLAAKALAKHLGHIGLVINDEDAKAHAALSTMWERDCFVATLLAMTRLALSLRAKRSNLVEAVMVPPLRLRPAGNAAGGP